MSNLSSTQSADAMRKAGLGPLAARFYAARNAVIHLRDEKIKAVEAQCQAELAALREQYEADRAAEAQQGGDQQPEATAHYTPLGDDRGLLIEAAELVIGTQFGSPDLDDEPVHGYFGLTYSSYQVMPRVLMQSMPALWQRQMVRLLEQMHDAFRHVSQPECYDVQPAIQVEASSLTEAQRKTTGVTQEWEGDEEDGSFVYRDANGDELESWSRVLVHVADPLPPYNRGRTRVPTRQENEAQRAAEVTR